MNIVVDLMDVLGLEQNASAWCGARRPRADKFVKAIREMTEEVRQLGASPYRTGLELVHQGEEVAECQSR